MDGPGRGGDRVAEGPAGVVGGRFASDGEGAHLDAISANAIVYSLQGIDLFLGPFPKLGKKVQDLLCCREAQFTGSLEKR